MIAGPVQVNRAVHFDFDGAWATADIMMPTIDLKAWGPKLRHTAPKATIEQFYCGIRPHLLPFTLYGSGDFHHLTALWLRGMVQRTTVVCFDNHPDWDRRPPRWSCGGWVNRALAMRRVEHVAVWGCGNFELAWPARCFGNMAAVKSGRLALYPWTERQGPSVRKCFPCISRNDWRARRGSHQCRQRRRSRDCVR